MSNQEGFSITLRPDGKWRLRKRTKYAPDAMVQQMFQYPPPPDFTETDHGDYATLADAQKAMDRIIKPQVFYYDAHGNRLDE